MPNVRDEDDADDAKCRKKLMLSVRHRRGVLRYGREEVVPLQGTERYTNPRHHFTRMKLFAFEWGLFPRRALTYLSEKGIPADEIEVVPVTFDMEQMRMVADGMPDGHNTVPILHIRDDLFIYQSIAILYYLEEMYPQPNMHGTTPEERARVRDLLAIVDEACIHFGVAARNGSALSRPGGEQQDQGAGRMALAACRKQLSLLERHSDPDGPFLVRRHDTSDGSDPHPTPTIVDCVTFSFPQFSSCFYGKDLMQYYPRLKRFYEAFRVRPSADCPPYPAAMASAASRWTL
jgi:glutathione S-transferase